MCTRNRGKRPLRTTRGESARGEAAAMGREPRDPAVWRARPRHAWRGAERRKREREDEEEEEEGPPLYPGLILVLASSSIRRTAGPRKAAQPVDAEPAGKEAHARADSATPPETWGVRRVKEQEPLPRRSAARRRGAQRALPWERNAAARRRILWLDALRDLSGGAMVVSVPASFSPTPLGAKQWGATTGGRAL
ncbi:unnamed protein product [Prorocentrum cordatum]|uniref:Uncharacterized protein n=1 Tax=Prorocentrum cordatum TaxID=2364126 RepID=A0ABN9S049_9DINO|nr:unnamed protein product [Polarella glacialis]